MLLSADDDQLDQDQREKMQSPPFVEYSEMEARKAVIGFIERSITITSTPHGVSADDSVVDTTMGSTITLLPVWPLLTHPSVLLAPSISRLLALFLRINHPSQRLVFLRRSGSAWMLCCTLPIVLSSLSWTDSNSMKIVKSQKNVGDMDEEDEEEEEDDDVVDDDINSLLNTWCTAYFAIVDSLLDTLIVYVTAMGDVPSSHNHPHENRSSVSLSETTERLDHLVELLLPLLSLSTTGAFDRNIHTSFNRAMTRALLHGKNQTNRVKSLRKKLNRWVKVCLKNGLQSPVVVQALMALVAVSTRTRASTKTRVNAKNRNGYGVMAVEDDSTLWDILFPFHDPSKNDQASSSCYDPSTMLEMIVSHSKFSTLLMLSGSMASLHRSGSLNKQKQQKQGPGLGAGSAPGPGLGHQQGGSSSAPSGRLHTVNVPLVRLLVVLIGHSCSLSTSSSTQSNASPRGAGGNISTNHERMHTHDDDVATTASIVQTLTTRPTVPPTPTAMDQLLVHQVSIHPPLSTSLISHIKGGVL